jgi:hypothetical protein
MHIRGWLNNSLTRGFKTGRNKSVTSFMDDPEPDFAPTRRLCRQEPPHRRRPSRTSTPSWP